MLIRHDTSSLWLLSNKRYITVGKRNYFTGYGILLHELLAVVVVLFTQSNNVLELQNLDVVKYGITM